MIIGKSGDLLLTQRSERRCAERGCSNYNSITYKIVSR